jgi:hypothetical protein
MPFPIRVLTEAGIQAFREYLQALAAGEQASPPRELLYSPEHSAEFNGNPVIEQRAFTTTLEAADYLADAFSAIDDHLIENNAGLWAWLSLFYFDQTCPPDQSGMRRPGRAYRHIPETDYRHRHRHLLKGPYDIFRRYGDNARLLLCTPLHKENKFLHELAARQNIISNEEILKVATILYFDEAKRRHKSGAMNERNAGSLNRFVSLMQQLDLTYDLFSMRADQLLKLLPSEFDRWRPPMNLLS